MILIGLLSALALTLFLTAGCAGASRAVSPLVWHEGEDYSRGPEDVAVGVMSKAPASGGKSLTGGALDVRGKAVVYDVVVPIDIPQARLLLRYSRHHWEPMPPATLGVEMADGRHRLCGQAVLDKTGGWGAKDKAEWQLAGVDLGDLPAGRWTLTLTSLTEGRGDVCIDGFFLAPAAISVITEELAADRIDITSARYVGVDVASTLIRQDRFDGLRLIARGFVPTQAGVKVTLLDAAVRLATVLFEKSSLDLPAEAARVAVPCEPLRELGDGRYTIRTEWQGAPPSEIRVEFVGRLASGFTARLDRLEAFHSQRRIHTPGAEYVGDYDHVLAWLREGWARIETGRNERCLADNLARTLDQYEKATRRLAEGKAPFDDMRGDIRRAFVSATSGKIEPYRIFLPDSYRPDGRTPCMLVLNHNEDNYLDQADGVTKRLANERGYTMISPRASSGYWGEGQKDLLQFIDLIMNAYPGLDWERLYATGSSAGAFGSYSLATDQPGLLKAIACSAGVGNWQVVKAPPEGLLHRFAPVPTLIIHGRLDSQVPIETAERVAGELVKRGIPHELKIGATRGHDYDLYAAEYFGASLDYFDRHPPRT